MTITGDGETEETTGKTDVGESGLPIGGDGLNTVDFGTKVVDKSGKTVEGVDLEERREGVSG